MTDKIEELIERLRVRGRQVTQIYDRVNRIYAKSVNEPQPPVVMSDAELVMIDAADALRTQRDEVIEECAAVASEMGDAWHREWRAGLKASTHLEGKSDGADEIAAAIRNLKSQDEPSIHSIWDAAGPSVG